ncbi:unnamed protein product, partial [Scytosiphon promiscuus]
MFARAKMREIFDGKHYAASTDIWTGGKNEMFISITVHVIVGTDLLFIDLVCAPFNVAHTGVNIAVALRQLLKERGLDPNLCVGITMDNAAIMIKAGEVL